MHSVLVVDDEPFVRLSLVALFSAGLDGFDFATEAADGAEALAVLAARAEIDIVLLDLSMPVMDGLEVLRRLRAEPPPRPLAVIVLSAHDDYHLVREAFKLGAIDYLLKRELDADSLRLALAKAASGLASSTTRTAAILQRRELELLKAQVLRDVLATSATPELAQTFAGLDIALAPPFAVCGFWIEDLDAVARREGGDSLARFAELTTRSLQQTIAAAGHGEVVLMAPDHAVVLFCPPARAGASPDSVARAFCEDAAEYLARYLSVKVTFAIGPMCDAIGEAPEALAAARATRRVESRIVVLAKRAIHERFADPEFSLEVASARAGVSKNHLSFEFSRETGETFTEYVARMRIDEAKRLLATTSLLIYEIGARVGYPSVEHFSRVFKKVAGVSPAKFRGGVRLPAAPEESP